MYPKRRSRPDAPPAGDVCDFQAIDAIFRRGARLKDSKTLETAAAALQVGMSTIRLLSHTIRQLHHRESWSLAPVRCLLTALRRNPRRNQEESVLGALGKGSFDFITVHRRTARKFQSSRMHPNLA
eukprot:1356119-Amorphochlora_amoeboformis.AAC.3